MLHPLTSLLGNVVLKINAKLGGINTIVKDSLPIPSSIKNLGGNIMFIGAATILPGMCAVSCYTAPQNSIVTVIHTFS
jgi:hypothetical protein